MLGGILWRRANRWGALASLVCALAANFILYLQTGQRFDHWDANVFLVALLTGIAALVIVSLLTPPEPDTSVVPFFDRLRTSSDDESPDRPLLLVNALNPHRGASGRGWRAYREDLGGFALGWVLVVVLVAVTGWWLAT